MVEFEVPDIWGKEELPTVLDSLGELKMDVCAGGPGYAIRATGAIEVMEISLTMIGGFADILGAG